MKDYAKMGAKDLISEAMDSNDRLTRALADRLELCHTSHMEQLRELGEILKPPTLDKYHI